MVCQFIFSTPSDRLYLPTSGGMYYAVRPPSTGAELAGAHEGAPRRNAFLPAERMGMEGNTAMRFPGIVLPRKMNKTKNSHKSPENSGFQPARPVYPRLHKTHILTLFGKSRNTGTYNYRSTWKNNVEDSIGRYKVVQVLPSDIKKLYSGLSQKGFAKSSIKHVHNLLHPVLEMAVDDDIIRRNPVKSVWGDYGREPEGKKALTLAQHKRLMEFVESDTMYKCYCPMLTIMLGTGVRCGELVGLTWDDVDMGKKEIHIRRTLVYKDYGDGLRLHVSTPKTKSGTRTIPMSDSVYNAFAQQKELNSLLGKDHNAFEVEGLKGFVFITRNGRPLLMCSVNRVLANIVKAINALGQEETFPPISAHTMRHTFCTRMAENGMDIKVLQYLMGHANINITMQVYNHIADSSRIENELARINALAVNF